MKELTSSLEVDPSILTNERGYDSQQKKNKTYIVNVF